MIHSKHRGQDHVQNSGDNTGHKGLIRRVAQGVRACAALLLWVGNSGALAWGSEGHQVVALVAERYLSPSAQAGIGRLLALEPGETLASISTWADTHKNRQTAAWHYVNLPQGQCEYRPARDCRQGRCVVEAIGAQLNTLTSSAPDADKLTALKYLVHLVADVHQPLHAGMAEDKGGNTYQVQAFSRGSNLHAVWDSGLIKSFKRSPAEWAQHLKPLPAEPTHHALGAAQAAEESCRLVHAPGFYPAQHAIDADYLERHTPILERRLAVAGLRLGLMLNEVFRGDGRPGGW